MIVARHFWPHCSGRHEAAAAAFSLAQTLSAAGMQVEVVTLRHGNAWPTEIVLGEIKVHRIATAPGGDWAMQRYIRHLGHWLVEQSPRLDAIVCDQMREECRAVAVAIQTSAIEPGLQKPLGIAMCDGWGDDSDETWCRVARGGKRVLQSAGLLDAIVTRHAATDRFLVSQGIAAESLRRLPSGFERPPTVSEAERLAARKSLMNINTDLQTNHDSRVLLWCGHMVGSASSESPVGAVVQSARLLAAREPNLKIWLLGDGKLRDWVHTELRAEGVRSVVALPGTFSDMTEIWQSVDAVVINDEHQLRSTFMAAISSAIPMIVADRPSIRLALSSLFDDVILDSLAWYDPAKPSTLRKAFKSLWSDLPLAKQHAFELASDLSRRHGTANEVTFWKNLIRRPLHNANLSSNVP